MFQLAQRVVVVGVSALVDKLFEDQPRLHLCSTCFLYFNNWRIIYVYGRIIERNKARIYI